MPQQMRLAGLAVLALLCGDALAQSGASQAVPASAASVIPLDGTKAVPLRYITPDTGFAYFSGHTKNNHNHPAIYASQGEIQKLVVIGRNYREEFPISQSQQAFEAYRALLEKAHYQLKDPNNGRSPLMPPVK